MELETQASFNEDPQSVSAYSDIIFSYLREKEASESEKRNFDYLQNMQTDINENMRAILIDWLTDVHLKFKLKPETLFLTVNIIDRFLEKISV